MRQTVVRRVLMVAFVAEILDPTTASSVASAQVPMINVTELQTVQI